MHRQPHSRPPRVAPALLAVACWMGAFGTSAAEPETARAVLKQQEISFYYQSFTSFYSCEGLRDKVRRLLLALGASKDLDVQVRSGCESSNGPVRNPLVIIRLTSPVQATPEALAELEKTRAQRELTARVRGDRGEGIDAAAQFDALWKPVSLSKGKLGLDPGDCELVDQMARKVLPKLGVRVVKNSLSCPPKQINRSQPRLEVEALTQPPPPDKTSSEGTPPADSASPAPTESSPPAAPSEPQP